MVPHILLNSPEAGEDAKKAISMCEVVKGQLQLVDEDCSHKLGKCVCVCVCVRAGAYEEVADETAWTSAHAFRVFLSAERLSETVAHNRHDMLDRLKTAKEEQASERFSVIDLEFMRLHKDVSNLGAGQGI